MLACIEYKALWLKEGVFSLLLRLIKENYQPSSSPERSLTNMMHLAEGLAKNAILNKLPEQQLAWFSQQVFEHTSDEESQLRLESDANLIKIITQHGSKGLEYPIVFVPFADSYKNPSKRGNTSIQHYKYQDMAAGEPRYQLGKTKSSIDEYVKQAHAEEIRLLYVAITRAEYRCYLGMIDDVVNAKSSLHSILDTPEHVFLKPIDSNEFTQDNVQCELVNWMTQHIISKVTDKGIASPSQAEINPFDPNSSIVNVDQAPVILNINNAAEKIKPETPDFLSLDISKRSAWLISSFSNLSRFQKNNDKQYYDVAIPNQISLHAIETAGEHLTLLTPQTLSLSPQDPLSKQQTLLPEDGQAEAPNSLRFSLKKGADTGNLLHDILEQVDFNSPDWQTASSAALASYDDIEQEDVSALFDWLSSCLHTPLLPNFCMADLVVENTLREAEFYFPMPNLKVTELAKLLTQYRHHIEEKKGFDALPISMPNIPELTGMMHGFIDLIFEENGKFYVADYKSTHLGNAPEDYKAANLHENNQHHLYDLQYLLYSLALHKYLQQHLSDYAFEKHFGGVFYLYLRGMSPDYQFNKESAGVFFDKVEPKFIYSLNELFNAKPKDVQLHGALDE